MRFCSQRPRVTVSRIRPQVSDRKASSIRPVASTAVGRRGTWPVFRYSVTTGVPIDQRQRRQHQEEEREEDQRPFLAHQIADGGEDAKAVAPGVELGHRAQRPFLVARVHLHHRHHQPHRMDGQLGLDAEALARSRERI